MEALRLDQGDRRAREPGGRVVEPLIAVDDFEAGARRVALAVCREDLERGATSGTIGRHEHERVVASVAGDVN